MPSVAFGARHSPAGTPWITRDEVLFHALVIGFIVVAEFLYAPAHDLGPDNTWHYRMARELVEGRPFYWAGIDGNRLFPDLIVAATAYVLSGRALFEGWVPAFYIVFFLALYGSLLVLAATLYERTFERRAFALLAVAASWALLLAAPFWARWINDPGNHGTGLPVALLCLAIVFRMIREERFHPLLAAAFVALASLLVGSNRFLLLAFLVPLLLALVGLVAARWAANRVEQRRATFTLVGRSLHPLPALIGTVVVALVGSYLAYRALSNLSWHRSTTYMGVQIVNRDLSLAWATEKFWREIADLVRYVRELTWQVAVGPLLMAATIPAGLVLLVRSIRRGASPLDENRVTLGLFAALSGLLSAAFVIWGWEENGDWRYRYLAMAIAFALTFLATFLVGPALRFRRPGWAGAALLAGLAALTLIPMLHRDSVGRTERKAKFQREVEEIRRWVEGETGMARPRGLGEYWAVMDVTARTRLTAHLLDERGRAQFYNNNAGSLCGGNYTFVLRKTTGTDAPRRGELVARLGEPRATRTFELEGHGRVEIMVYDPATLQAGIVEEGLAEARKLFPRLRCPPGARS